MITRASRVFIVIAAFSTAISFCMPPRVFPTGKLKIDCKKAKKEARDKKKKMKKADWPPMSL